MNEVIGDPAHRGPGNPGNVGEIRTSPWPSPFSQAGLVIAAGPTMRGAQNRRMSRSSNRGVRSSSQPSSRNAARRIAPTGRSRCEVEFDAGIAAMERSGDCGPIKVAQSIVGHADLALGDRVRADARGTDPRRSAGFRGCAIRSAKTPTRPSATADWARRPICTPGPKSAPGWHGSPRTGWRSMPVGATFRNSAMHRAGVGGAGGDDRDALRRRRCLDYGAYAGKKDEVHTAVAG